MVLHVPSHETPVAAPALGPYADEVVLLDTEGRPSGTADRLRVHGPRTPLHLAFSVHLLDGSGRTLLTRRALGKTTWPGVWTGSCCGHPRPGEDPADAVVRRVAEELGVVPVGLEVVLPDFRYRAVDASGVVEHEVCPVYVAHLAETADDTPERAVLAPDPAEVAEHAWVAWADLHASVTGTPFAFSPWTVLQVRELGPDVPGTRS